ncbi:hypothetical protein CAOG_06314 [Capsaspora owczarzaki ATCC 30864]|uniref:DUF1168 domain-containing protein n=1 Tax=Capsaspora owczarzaki (strain ATCC 30864) TaxID=595528 RepID=A0A0D2VWG4_CAPO3|nr:hypothetical protein CAOG_06314 [Capsaspora owczarzaki ATCC 30864]KJE95922.1 hypothetical protein CAOG_006314 [Capsaspora owczarzaki ATCC 30864]|eukprot:XP_004345063.1 hypothetical protein CAOG_06314 [Capsaspora owczarzaki ATCC 30864]
MNAQQFELPAGRFDAPKDPAPAASGASGASDRGRGRGEPRNNASGAADNARRPAAATGGGHVGPATAADAQRRQLDALMKHPEREIVLPAAPSKHRAPRGPKDLIHHVAGSTAGAGSGEFHVYRNAKRREEARLRALDEMSEAERADYEFHARAQQFKEEEAAALAKKRSKRQRKKQLQQLRNKKARQEGGQKTGGERATNEDDDDDDEDDSEEEEEGEGGPAEPEAAAASILKPSTSD